MCVCVDGREDGCVAVVDVVVKIGEGKVKEVEERRERKSGRRMTQ